MQPLRLFDAHLHIIDPRFPLTPNQGFLPEPFTAADYRVRVASLPGAVVGGAVVSGSFQGFDQTYLRAALAKLGPGFVGVTQVPATTPDADILALHAAGVRAIRFNLRRGGSEGLSQLEALAGRVFDLAGWHVELYVAAADLVELEPRLRALPRVSIDHLGLVHDLDEVGMRALLRLVEQGARVKATGFGRIAADVPAVLRAIAAVDPSALLFGTDLPSTRAPRPFANEDVLLICETLGEAIARGVLFDNAAAFYRLEQPMRHTMRQA